MDRPTFQIKDEETKNDYGRFVFEPLEQGYGHTLGSSFRRVLLNSLPGAALTQVKVSGLKHQFGSIKGVREDGVELLLNLKRVRFAYKGDKPVKATLEALGKGEVTAGQIKVSAEVKIANPELHIATLAGGKSKLSIDMQIEPGIGYSPAQERKTNTVGVIPVDADFSPVKRVNYRVEETRVGRLTNYDKLTLEVWTDGTAEPKEAIDEAAKILSGYLAQIISPVKPKKKEEKEVSPRVRDLSVEELRLPTRITNALVKAGYDSAADLVENWDELSRVRNLGAKSVKVIEAALKEKDINPEE